MRRLGLLALLVIAAIGAGAGWLDFPISPPYRGHRPEKVFVDIPHGKSRWAIAGILRQDDVIRNRLAFTLFSVWHFRAPMDAGEYFFDHPVTSREVFWQLAQGRIFVHTVTIPEGWMMFDIAAELDREGVCTRDAFLDAAKDTTLISDLAPQAQNLEGFLFPSTYEFTHHTTCEQAAKRMVQNFRAVWESLNSSGTASLPDGLTADQVVTLASLVERETPRKDERPLVAGVVYNRIKRGGPLQCDPTVASALDLACDPGKTPPSPRRRRVLQSHQAWRPFAVRSHRRLRFGTGRSPGKNRARQGFADRFAVQHLQKSRPASRPDRQSRRSVVARRAHSCHHGLHVFRRQRFRRTFFQQNSRRAQSQRRALSQPALP